MKYLPVEEPKRYSVKCAMKKVCGCEKSVVKNRKILKIIRKKMEKTFSHIKEWWKPRISILRKKIEFCVCNKLKKCQSLIYCDRLL